jgi:hypothetical protein
MEPGRRRTLDRATIGSRYILQAAADYRTGWLVNSQPVIVPIRMSETRSAAMWISGMCRT